MFKCFIKTMGVFLLIGIAFANVKYNPSNVATYNNTGKCPGCDLSGATLFCQSNSILDGAILNKANFEDPNQCGNSSFKNIFGINTVFGNSGYPSSDFSGAKLRGANFQSSNLSSAIFANADLTNATFFNAILTRTDFKGANLTGADLAHTDLTESNITLQQLKSAKTYCDAILPDGSKGPSC